MKLSEYLLYRDISELDEMATLYECDCNRNSKLELVQSIHYRMLSKSIYQQMLSNMDESIITFVTYILFQGTSTFQIDELTAKGKFICSQFQWEVSPRSMIAEMMKKGWLFPASTRLQIQLEIPVDIHSLLKKQIIQYWLTRYNLEPQQQIKDTVLDEGNSILHDVQIFLKFIEEMPLPLTIEGFMHKRYQQLILQKLNIQEQPITEKGWRFGYGRRFPAYPNRLALIYDFCFHKEWIIEEQGMVSVTNKATKRIDSDSLLTEEVHRELVQYWMKIYKKPIPVLPFLIHFSTHLLENRWIKINELFSVLEPWLNDFYYDGKEAIFRERMTQMLTHLGLIQLSISNEGSNSYYRIKKEQYNKFFI
jgi:hypothetical protein